MRVDLWFEVWFLCRMFLLMVLLSLMVVFFRLVLVVDLLLVVIVVCVVWMRVLSLFLIVLLCL